MENQNNNDNPQGQQLNIELTEDVAEGIYANLAVIAHSPSEFVIDFVNVMPGMPKARVRSRIVMTPEHAKRLLAALNDNIQRYENSFGEIRGGNQEGGNEQSFPFPFRGPQGMA